MRLLRSACAVVATVLGCAIGAAAALADTVVINPVNVPSPAFQPASTTIDPGDTIRWEFGLSTTSHTVTSSSPNWSMNEVRDPGGAPIERKFETAGTYTFLCLIHSGMNGSISVRDSPEPGPDPIPNPIPEPTLPAPPPDTMAPRPEPSVEAAISVPQGPRAVSARRLASVATLRCPSGGADCSIAAPKRVNVSIAGRRFTLSVLAPQKVSAGGRATVRVRLPYAAAKRLAGRRASVTIRLSVAFDGTRASRTVKVTITRKATS